MKTDVKGDPTCGHMHDGIFYHYTTIGISGDDSKALHSKMESIIEEIRQGDGFLIWRRPLDTRYDPVNNEIISSCRLTTIPEMDFSKYPVKEIGEKYKRIEEVQ